MSNPNSVQEWLDLALLHQEQAKTLARGNGSARAGVLSHVGHAVEAALKAAIMDKERLNSWPMRKKYWKHDPVKLAPMAGYAIDSNHAVAEGWAVVIAWDRQQDYSPKATPVAVARGYLDAAFGPNGVVTWIRAQLT